MKMEELSSCPFCGAVPHRIGFFEYYVTHKNDCFFYWRDNAYIVGKLRVDKWQKREALSDLQVEDVEVKVK